MKRMTKVWMAAAGALVASSAAADEARLEEARLETARVEEVRVEEAPVAARPAEVRVPVSLSLVPGLGNNGLDSGNVVNHLSVGLVGTHAGRLEGLAASLGANWVDREVLGLETALGFNVAGGRVRGGQTALGFNVAGRRLSGLQAALAFNVVSAEARGAQLAVGANVVTGRMVGLQGAVGANVAVGEVLGLQGAVGANVAAHEVRGVQAAAGANVAVGHMVGLQASSGISFARSLQGAQVSIVNIGGDVEGAQVGLVNLARRVTGVQLGLVNLAQEAHGAPIGLVSLSGNGQLHVQAWSSDVALGNVALKFGSRHLHTLVAVGFQPGGREERRWTTGLGLGGHIPLGPLFVDLDALASSVHSDLTYADGGNLLAQLRLVGGLQLAPHLALFGGVTGNAFLRTTGRDFEGLGNRFAWERTRGTVSVRAWPGFVAGLQL